MECMGEKTKQVYFGSCPMWLPVGQRNLSRKKQVVSHEILRDEQEVAKDYPE